MNKRTLSTCKYCGNKYYVCRSCVGIYSWKNSCDTPECYQKLIQMIANNGRTEKTKSKKKENPAPKKKGRSTRNSKPKINKE